MYNRTPIQANKKDKALAAAVLRHVAQGANQVRPDVLRTYLEHATGLALKEIDVTVAMVDQGIYLLRGHADDGTPYEYYSLRLSSPYDDVQNLPTRHAEAEKQRRRFASGGLFQALEQTL